MQRPLEAPRKAASLEISCASATKTEPSTSTCAKSVGLSRPLLPGADDADHNADRRGLSPPGDDGVVGVAAPSGVGARSVDARSVEASVASGVFKDISGQSAPSLCAVL